MSDSRQDDNHYDDLARRLVFLYHESGKDDEGDVDKQIRRELLDTSSRYTEKTLIDRGGMKIVSQVFDSKTSRYVAMAELREGAPEGLYETFLREARLTALFNHPNIISIHDIGISAEGTPFFTMDLKKGDSLGVILKALRGGNRLYQEQYPNAQLLMIFYRICSAVAYAHSKKVIHLEATPV
jgi:serine/threonine protein kinase